MRCEIRAALALATVRLTSPGPREKLELRGSGDFCREIRDFLVSLAVFWFVSLFSGAQAQRGYDAIQSLRQHDLWHHDYRPRYHECRRRYARSRPATSIVESRAPPFVVPRQLACI